MKNKIDAVIFDCDGTLSAIEGITELATLNNKTEIIRQLTEEAMGGSGLTIDLYRQRLDIVKPTRQQCKIVAEKYIQHVTRNAKETIKKLQENNIAVYIMSAGVDACVLPFAKYLNITANNTFSVPILFTPNGTYQNFDATCELTSNDGKLILAKNLKNKHNKIVAVGDGMNDVSMKSELVKFIGFGGAFYREKIKALSDHYITENDMKKILEYCL
jgi:phosphoserine phosphatase